MSQQPQQYPQTAQPQQPQQQARQQPHAGGYQPSYEAQTQMGQQLQASPMGQAIGQRFQESVPQEVQQLVADLERLETITEWVKSRATLRGMPRVASRADDLSEIAHLEKQLVVRQSPFAEPIGKATQQTIQQGIQELQQRAGEPEVQEVLTQAQRVTADINQALGRLQAFGQQGQQSQPPRQGQPPQQGQF